MYYYYFLKQLEIGSISILLQTTWHGITLFERCLWSYILQLKDVIGSCFAEVKIFLIVENSDTILIKTAMTCCANIKGPFTYLQIKFSNFFKKFFLSLGFFPLIFFFQFKIFLIFSFFKFLLWHWIKMLFPFLIIIFLPTFD